MKKKIIFAVATGLFAVATMFNMNLLQANNAGDISLENISVMANAQSESGGSGLANLCCPIWVVSVEIYWYGTKINCTTGGEYKCNDCDCPN